MKRLLVLVLIASCGDDSTAPAPDAAASPDATPDTTVVVFDHRAIDFNGSDTTTSPICGRSLPVFVKPIWTLRDVVYGDPDRPPGLTQTVDLATTAVPGQHGTWQYSRAGWCPGADVRAWTIDVSADVAGASQAGIAYDVEAYINTCRPDASPCQGCTLGTSCPYDGGAHTEPRYSLSGLLVGLL